MTKNLFNAVIEVQEGIEYVKICLFDIEDALDFMYFKENDDRKKQEIELILDKTRMAIKKIVEV